MLAAPVVAMRVDWAVAGKSLAAAALACVAAAGTYLINDAADVGADRLHPTKRSRPVAAGQISPRSAVVAGVALLLGATTVATAIGWSTALWLAGYGVLTVVYSLRLKRIPVVDVLAIAAGFVVRVLIGGAATSTQTSPWFLAAVASGAVMIATGKRRGELGELGVAAAAHRASLATYRNAVTRSLIVAGAVGCCAAIVGWATIGNGGPRLGMGWAGALVVPVLVGVGRYLRVALAGRAARPERLLHDGVLLGCAAAATVLFLLGHAIS